MVFLKKNTYFIKNFYNFFFEKSLRNTLCRYKIKKKIFVSKTIKVNFIVNLLESIKLVFRNKKFYINMNNKKIRN